MVLRELLPEGVKGITFVLENTSNQTYTYQLDGGDAFYKGAEDLHDRKYNSYEVNVTLSLHSNPKFAETLGHCIYEMVRQQKKY